MTDMNENPPELTDADERALDRAWARIFPPPRVDGSPFSSYPHILNTTRSEGAVSGPEVP
jgi:hypothetical protein